MALVAVNVVTAQEREPRPAANCMDARDLVSARHLATGDLLLFTGEQGYLLSMHPECRADLSEDDTLLSPSGWVCGRDDEYVQHGDLRCPVVAVEPMDAREHARRAREHDLAKRGEPSRLATVEVRAAKHPGVIGRRGHPDYCFSPATVRGWQVHGNEVIVQTSPRRALGRKQYRIQLASACPELTRLKTVAFQSGIDTGLICGNPGDKIVSYSAPGFIPDISVGIGPISFLARYGCAISEVYSDG